MHYEYFQSPIGWLRIVENEGSIIEITKSDEPKENNCFNAVTAEAVRQLKEYFEGKRREFDLPLEIRGSNFQQRVYNALMKVPYGSTVSYRQLSRMAGIEKGFQATGQAVGRNPLLIVIPCHRVIRSDGSLGGFAYGEQIKKQLLLLEGGYRL